MRKPPTPLPAVEVIEAHGLRFMVFATQDMVGSILRRKGHYEPEVASIARILLQRREPGTVLDIGANIGTFALPLARDYPGTRIECFEIQPVVHHQLCGNIVLNGAANVRAHHLGLSDEPARITMAMPDYRVETNIAAFSLDEDARTHDYECTSVGDTETVPLATLDSLAYGDVRLIKIDVEGLEMKVLRGGRRTLEVNNFPPILLEAWTERPWFEARRTALLGWLRDLGYDVLEFGLNSLAQHPRHGAMTRFEMAPDRRSMRKVG